MRALLAALIAAALIAPVLAVSSAEPGQAFGGHGIAMHGSPREPAGFTHFPYVNPDAPKGGRLRLAVFGSYDSVNPMIVNGEPVQGVREFVVESLMARSQDEPFTLYGLIAQSIEVSDDRREVLFRLDPRARFSDGQPITADDVLFSFEVLREKGRPNYRTYYGKVGTAERVSEREVRFVLAEAGDREMPLILGLMPVLPKHATNRDKFDATSLAPMIGSGPYRMTKVDQGRSVTYVRNPDYWGRDLAVNRGRFNFDEIRFEYFREASSQFEAFKTGQIDLRTEEDPALWAGGYTFPAAVDGRVVKEETPTGLPAGMTGLAFNTRHAQFQDARVREALILLFNFEWVNKTLFNDLYQRTESYFARSGLASNGHPASAREREYLAPFPGSVLPEILEGRYRQPVGDGTGHNRANARRALDLLKQAGYELTGGVLTHRETGLPLRFEILAASRGQERVHSTYAVDLARLGIGVSQRVVDSAQYQSRLKTYEFDMIQFTWPASLSPGNEQLFRWSSKVADQPGSFNYPAVKNPAADAMIANMLAADGSEDFVAAVRALDRVLLSGYYVVPLFYVPRPWVAYWNHLARPERYPLFGFNADTWWVKRAN